MLIQKYINILKKNNFEHRQGSGYISKEELTTNDITILITKMTLKLDWLKYCIKKIDVTNIGKQHSLLTTIKNSFDEIDLLFINKDKTLKEIIYKYINENVTELEKLFKQSVSLFINQEIY